MYNDDDIPSPSYDSLSDNTIFLISILSIKCVQYLYQIQVELHNFY